MREKYKFKPFFSYIPPFLNSKMGICNPANCYERLHCIKLRTLRLETTATLCSFLPLGTGSHHTHTPLGQSCGERCISSWKALYIFSSLHCSVLMAWTLYQFLELEVRCPWKQPCVGPGPCCMLGRVALPQNKWDFFFNNSSSNSIDWKMTPIYPWGPHLAFPLASSKPPRPKFCL